MEGRTYAQRVWKAVEKQRLTLKSAGWHKEDFLEAEGVVPEEEAAEEEEDAPEREQVSNPIGRGEEYPAYMPP